jgi:outer membrane lipoprotein-sorting protein
LQGGLAAPHRTADIDEELRKLNQPRLLWAVAAFAVACLCITPALHAQTAKAVAAKPAAKKRDLTNDQQAIDLLRQLEQKYGGIKAVSGAFQQVREDPAMEERIESYANFALLKPNKFRADYQPPRQSTNLITDDYFYRYIKDLKQVERYHFQGRLNPQDFNYMVLGFGVKVEDLLKVYAVKWLTTGVARGYHGLQLVPLESTSNFKYVTILVTSDTLQPAQFSMEQLDGVRTTANLNLGTLKLGAAVDGRQFSPDFPREAQIVDIR